MSTEVCGESLEVSSMSKVSDTVKPLVAVKPQDMTLCVVCMSVEAEVSVSDRQALLELLESPLTLDEDFEITIGTCSNDIQEKVESAMSNLRTGETATIHISLPSSSQLMPESCQSGDQKGSDKIDICDRVCDKSIAVNVTLRSFENQPFMHQLTSSQKLMRASFYKELGTSFFKQHKIERAFQKYSRAMKYLLLITEPETDSQTMYDTLKYQCFLNLAACQMEYKGYDLVVKNCTEALGLDSSSVKARYRRAMALKHKHELKLAVDDLTCALELEPENKAVQKELRILRERISTEESGLAKAMSKMFT